MACYSRIVNFHGILDHESFFACSFSASASEKRKINFKEVTKFKIRSLPSIVTDVDCFTYV